MLTCTICHFDTNEDDVVVHFGRGQCICLACYQRETGSALPMPASLRRELIAVLAVTEAETGADRGTAA